MNPNVWKDTIAVYSFFRDPITDNRTYIRTVLHNTFWDEDSIAVRQRTGTADVRNVTLYIPHNDRYLPSDEFARLPKTELQNHWTVAVGSGQEPSYILRFDCPFEFPWDTNSGLAGGAIRDFEREFAGRFRRARDVNDQLFGSKQLWHIAVRC